MHVRLMADHDKFVRALHNLARELGRTQRERAREGDVTPQQAETLLLIAERGAMSTSALAQALGIDPSTASRNLAGLESAGLISRKRGADDGRQTEIRLTPRGKRTAEHAMTAAAETLTQVFERLPRGERGRATDAIESIVKAFDAR